MVAARDEAGPDWYKEGDLGDQVDLVALVDLVDPGDLVEGDEDKDPVASCKYRISIEGVDPNNRDIYRGRNERKNLMHYEERKQINKTRPNTQLPQSRAGGQGLFLRSLSFGQEQ